MLLTKQFPREKEWTKHHFKRTYKLIRTEREELKLQHCMPEIMYWHKNTLAELHLSKTFKTKTLYMKTKPWKNIIASYPQKLMIYL